MNVKSVAYLKKDTEMNSNYVFSSYKGSQQGVSVRDLHLNQLSYFNTGFDIAGIAAGPHYNDVYLAAGNHLYHYQINGNLISNMAFPIPSVQYTDVTVSRDNMVYASYTGSQHGVSVRDLQLNQVSFFDTSFRINGIAAGPNNDMYLVSGNHIYHYQTNGTLMCSMAFPDNGVVYTDIVVIYNKIYATYKGSQRGVTVRDLHLNQIAYFSTNFVADSIAAGPNNDVYLASENHLYHYSVNGAQISDMVFPDTGVQYTGAAVIFKSMT